MGLFRLLFWVAIIFAGIWIWRRFVSNARKPRPREDAAAPMVRCAHCGVHIPKTQALSQDQQWYCSQGHLEQGPRTGDR